MPRSPRIILPQSYYHIMTRGNNKHDVFRSDEDYQYFLKLLVKYKKQHPFNLYHYCLMPNHVHLLIQTKKASDFSVFMKKINLAYFHYFNRKYGWVGHFWQDRFKSQPIGKDDYFIQCGKYIELNPVRKGIVEKPEDYPYSSYKFYANGNLNKLLTIDIFYQGLGDNKRQRQNYYQKFIIDDLVVKTIKKKTWGSYQQRCREAQKLSRKLKKPTFNL